MNISLPRQLEEWVDERVKTGMYQSASELVREALRLVEERDRARARLVRRRLAEAEQNTKPGNRKDHE